MPTFVDCSAWKAADQCSSVESLFSWYPDDGSSLNVEFGFSPSIRAAFNVRVSFLVIALIASYTDRDDCFSFGTFICVTKNKAFCEKCANRLRLFSIICCSFSSLFPADSSAPGRFTDVSIEDGTAVFYTRRKPHRRETANDVLPNDPR